MSSDYYGHIAGEIADEGDDDFWGGCDPEEEEAAIRRAEEPPDWVLEQEAEEAHERHCRDEHGGGKCDRPVAEPEYSDEAPF